MNEFDQALKEAGIPQSAQEMQVEWKKIAESENTEISNNSSYSPFWRIMSAMVSTPALWLVNFLKTFVLQQMFVKTASRKWLDFHAYQHNLSRKPASKAVGNITFYRAVNNQSRIEIPAQTRIATEPLNGTVYVLKTLKPQVMELGQNTLEIECEAADTGQAFNLSVDYFSRLLEPVTGIASVKNNEHWLIQLGSDIESDESLRLRIRDQFGGLSTFHVDSIYRTVLAKETGVDPNNLFFEHDAPRGAGTANIYFLAEIGRPSGEFITQLNRVIRSDGNHGHGDDIKVFAMPETEHTLDVTVWPSDHASESEKAELIQQVKQCILSAFRAAADYSDVTRTRPYSRFSSSRLIQELHRNLPLLAEIEIQGANIQSALSVPRIKTLNVELANG